MMFFPYHNYNEGKYYDMNNVGYKDMNNDKDMNNNYNKHKKMCEITKVGKNCKEKSRKKAVK